MESEGIADPRPTRLHRRHPERKYVEQLDRRFYATDLGEVVTDKLIEAFKELMDVGYTRSMESELDEIEDKGADWQGMLSKFYKGFSRSLATASDTMTHAKAEVQPSIYECPKCGAPTAYRFGKNGRSCRAPATRSATMLRDHPRRRLCARRVDVICPRRPDMRCVRAACPFLVSVKSRRSRYDHLDKKEAIKYPTPPALEVEVDAQVCGASWTCARVGAPLARLSKVPSAAAAALHARQPTSRADEGARVPRPGHPTVPEEHDGSVIPGGTRSRRCEPGGHAGLEIHPDSLLKPRTASSPPATLRPPAPEAREAPRPGAGEPRSIRPNAAACGARRAVRHWHDLQPRSWGPMLARGHA